MKRGGPLQRRSALRKVGKKGKRDAAELKAVEGPLRARSEGVCEFCSHRPASDKHHIKRRSQGGDNSLWNLIHLCAICHRWAHDHPAEAVKVGLLTHQES